MDPCKSDIEREYYEQEMRRSEVQLEAFQELATRLSAVPAESSCDNLAISLRNLNYEPEFIKHSVQTEEAPVTQLIANESRSGTECSFSSAELDFKADFVLVYHDKKSDERELPSRNDATFIATKQRLIYLENLSSYGLEIKQVKTGHNMLL